MNAPITKTRLRASCVRFKSTALMALLLLAVSCATHSRPDASHLSRKTSLDTDSPQTEKTLRDAYKQWKGTKHRMGGNDKKGVDCSGFVQAVYGGVFHIDLPRTAKEQLRQGKAVSRYALKAGDLVFFRPPGYPHHVGIYLGNNEFVHASKTKGVTISRMDPHYWGKYYWTARRVPPYH
jgi:probable lipoprotein NlpC